MSGAPERLPTPGGPRVSSPDSGDRPKLYVNAGQVTAVSEPTAIATVLGSCVSVCLWDPETRVGGMNHFLLAYHVEREHSARFGTIAVPALIRAVVDQGARRASLQAKVFGGASVIGSFRHRSLGEENSSLALRLLAEAGIPVLDHDVGGLRGRKLIFHSDDGTAWVKQL